MRRPPLQGDRTSSASPSEVRRHGRSGRGRPSRSGRVGSEAPSPPPEAVATVSHPGAASPGRPRPLSRRRTPGRASPCPGGRPAGSDVRERPPPAPVRRAGGAGWRRRAARSSTARRSRSGVAHRGAHCAPAMGGSVPTRPARPRCRAPVGRRGTCAQPTVARPPRRRSGPSVRRRRHPSQRASPPAHGDLPVTPGAPVPGALPQAWRSPPPPPACPPAPAPDQTIRPLRTAAPPDAAVPDRAPPCPRTAHRRPRRPPGRGYYPSARSPPRRRPAADAAAPSPSAS